MENLDAQLLEVLRDMRQAGQQIGSFYISGFDDDARKLFENSQVKKWAAWLDSQVSIPDMFGPDGRSLILLLLTGIHYIRDTRQVIYDSEERRRILMRWRNPALNDLERGIEK